MKESTATPADPESGAGRTGGNVGSGATGKLGPADLRRFKRYPAYKDSGVEWLGEIPAHWPVTKMWDIARATSGATPSKETLRFWDGGIPWVSPKDMKRRFLDSSEDTVSVAGISEAGLKLIPNPAVLVVVRGMILAHSFPVGVTRVPVTINQDMKALRLRGDVHPGSSHTGWKAQAAIFVRCSLRRRHTERRRFAWTGGE